ncbi:MAG: response regulator transcription factor [Anaerolineae bacterium]|nr:response regulator transcription factor [Anaerolineae bacterium]
MDKVIRVLIADDHLTERQGIAKVLNSAEDILVVGQVGQIELVLDEVRQRQPDVVLMDLKWEDDERAGITATTELKQRYPAMRVIAISVYDHLIPEALKAGADAALLKGFSGEELLQAIRGGHRPLQGDDY